VWARLADALTIAIVVLAVAVTLYGGGAGEIAGIRVSLRSAWRLPIWAVGIAVLRHTLVRWRPLHRRIIDAFRRIIGRAEPRYPDVVFEGWNLAARLPFRRLRSVEIGLGLILLYAALTVVMTYPQVRVLDRGVSLDLGDPLFSTWRLSWIAHQFPRDPLHLFDANTFYPEPRTLAYSDSMVVPALTAAPLVWLGVPQLLATNLLLLSGFFFSGAAMFLLVWSLTRHAPAALLAGFVFAFLPYRYMHYAHLELQMAQWMPLCLWALHRTITRGRLVDGLLTGLFLALQTLSSWYYGIFLATYLIPLTLLLLAGERRDAIMRSIRSLAAGAVLTAILVVPFAIPYFEARQTVGERPVQEIGFYSATPINYLAAHHRNTLFGKATAGWGGQERELFQGIAVPLIALIGLWPPLSRVRLAYAVALGVAFEISLGLNGALFPWLHEHVLPYRGLRVPARMGILVGLSLAVLVGYGVARICTRPSGRRSASLAFALLVALVAAEYHSTLFLKEIWREPPAIYQQLPDPANQVVLNLPIVAPDVGLEPIYMYFSTFRWHKLLNGYSGFSPPWYQMLVEHMKTFPDEESMADVHAHDVSIIIVHGAFFKEGAYEELIDQMDQRDDLRLIHRSRWDGSETRMYEVLNQAATSGRTHGH
jgi:hypothetical protein